MGKKRSEWKTKGLKRSEKSGNPFRDILRIWFHYFSDLTDWIEQMDDPRNTAYITYTQSDLVTLGIMKNICSVESMRGMDENFNEDECILNLSRITGGARHENMPDHGTLNYYLEKLSPQAFREVRTKMVGALLRSRIFEDSRIAGMHWRVILDGTQYVSFKERHCENCLKSVNVNDDGTKTVRYFHRVLEAKLVLAENIIISLDSEFIENESEDATKQDCEINASKRLLSRLKDDFPRLKICIQGDALYEAETIMEICENNGWKYLFTHKQGRQRTVDAAYGELDDRLDKTMVDKIGAEKGTGYFYNNVEKLAGKKKAMNMLEYRFETEDKDGNKVQHKMIWLTNLKLTKANLESVIGAARGRWKIENEGFNTQKNVLYKIEHLNSRDPNAMKNHYLLTQIADIIMQLYMAWDDARSTVKKGVRNMASWLLESFRKQVLTDSDMEWVNARTSIYLK